VKAQFGSTSLSVGPLLDVSNRGRILYKTMDWNTTPPVKGDAVKSVWFNVEESQKKFGVLEGVFSGGEGDVDDATQVIETGISEEAWPDIAHTLALGGGDIKLQIDCKGWAHYLKKAYYYRTGEAGKQDLSDKISELLAQDPNATFNINSARVTENTTQVAIYEDKDKTIFAQIKELIGMGDADMSRYIWGGYADRKFVYEQQPTTVAYDRSAADGVITSDGTIIPPWSMLPGRWVKISELIGNHIGTVPTMRRDPTMMFIESITYTAPYGLSMTGSKINNFKQRLERLGLE
jgi:hypothetical protein